MRDRLGRLWRTSCSLRSQAPSLWVGCRLSAHPKYRFQLIDEIDFAHFALKGLCKNPSVKSDGFVSNWRTVGPVRFQLIEYSRHPDIPSQDNSLVRRFSGATRSRPGWTRFVAFDGVSDVNDSDLLTGYRTPRSFADSHDPSVGKDGLIAGPILATRIAKKYFENSISSTDAVAKAHQEIQKRWGSGGRFANTSRRTGYRHGGRGLHPREIPQLALGVLEFRDSYGGNMEVSTQRWGDTEVWVKRAGTWSSLFPKSIWTQESDEQISQWKERHPRPSEPGSPQEEQWRQQYRQIDRKARENEADWLVHTVGRFPRTPVGSQLITIEPGWEAIVLCSDGARLTPDALDRWESHLGSGPPEVPDEVKTTDDVTFFYIEPVSRNLEMPHQNLGLELKI